MSLTRTAIIYALVIVAVAVVLVSTMGLAAMRDPSHRLHYLAPPTTLSAFLIAIAVMIAERDHATWIRAGTVWVLLATLNGVVTYAALQRR